MIGVIVFFFQTFLFGFTSAQECKIPCQECKEICPPMPQEYVGNWSLADPSSKYCPPETPCLYQKQDMSSWMCFCDPGNILYENTCAGNCSNCIILYTDSVNLTTVNNFTQYNIKCPINYSLNGYNLLPDIYKTGFFRYKYYCCPFNQLIETIFDTNRTVCNPESTDVSALTLQDVKCPNPKDTIRGFQLKSELTSPTSGQCWYTIICIQGPSQLDCSEKQYTNSAYGTDITSPVGLQVKCSVNQSFFYIKDLPRSQSQETLHKPKNLGDWINPSTQNLGDQINLVTQIQGLRSAPTTGSSECSDYPDQSLCAEFTATVQPMS